MIPYLPASLPTPAPDPWETRFWAFCADRRLMFQSCAACGRVRHPPVPVCPHCRSTEEVWLEAGDDAELFTWTVVRHPSHPDLVGRVPYVVAIAAFPSLQGVRLLTNLLGDPEQPLSAGMKLALVWQEQAPGLFLPRFAAKDLS